mgnify:FL=1|tara:strand:+ start:2648 stop:3289 length:642 start_codon:yes stop_codon:yes gene_type:complete
MQLKKIKVYGKLKDFLGQSTFEAAVKTPQQAINFLRANFVGIEKHMNDQLYKIKIGGNSVDGELLNMSASGDIQIIPVAIGARGFFKAVTNVFKGAVNLVTDVVSSTVNFVANNALSIGATLLTGGVGGLLTTIGTSLIIDGVTSLLSPSRPVSSSSSVGDTDPAVRGSYNFNGIQNISSSGVPIPILYGLVFSGSIIVSSSVDTAQIVKEIS